MSVCLSVVVVGEALAAPGQRSCLALSVVYCFRDNKLRPLKKDTINGLKRLKRSDFRYETFEIPILGTPNLADFVKSQFGVRRSKPNKKPKNLKTKIRKALIGFHDPKKLLFL